MRFNKPPSKINNMISLKVNNISIKMSHEYLKSVFEKYGNIGDIYIPRNRLKSNSTGYAFVRFYKNRDAVKAIKSMNGSILNGRVIRIQRAHYRSTYNKMKYNRRSCSTKRYSRSYSRSSMNRSRSYSSKRYSHSYSRSRSYTSRRDSRSYSRSRSHSSRRYSRSYSRSRSYCLKYYDRSYSGSRCRGHNNGNNGFRSYYSRSSLNSKYSGRFVR